MLYDLTLITLLLWLASEIRLALRQNSRQTGAESKDRGSFYLVALAYGGTFSLIFLLPRWFDLGHFPPWVQGLGLAMIWGGFLLRQWAVRELGRFFTVDVSIHAEQEVIQTGPYRILRHPSYTGLALIFAGIGLGFGSVTGFLCVLVLPLPGLLWRLHVEEAVLLQTFGDRYAEYCKRTWRLIPGIF